MYFAVMKMSLN